MPRENAAGPGDTGAEETGATAENQDAQNHDVQEENANRETRNANRKGSNGAATSTEVSGADLAEHLNLPAEIRQQIQNAKPGAKRGEAGAQRSEVRGRRSEGPPTGDLPGDEPGEENAENGNAETLPEETEGGEGGEGQEQQPERRGQGKQQPSAPKHWPPQVKREFDKRVGKIWKQRASAEERANQAQQLATQFQSELDRIRTATAESATAAPMAGGVLGKARNERQLDQLTSEAEAMIDLLDAHPEWLEAGQGEGENFRKPEEVRQWRSDAEKILRGGEGRRRQIREFTATRAEYDNKAREDWPELFDPQSREFHAAVAIANRYPWIRGVAEANYALGVMVEGFKALNSRGQQRNGNGNADTSPEDLDERLTPEYQRTHIPPTAPLVPGKPNGRQQPTSRTFKNIESMAEKFIRPGGANTQDLADILKQLNENESPANGARRAVAV